MHSHFTYIYFSVDFSDTVEIAIKIVDLHRVCVHIIQE